MKMATLKEQTALVDSLHRDLDRLEKWFRNIYEEKQAELNEIIAEYRKQYIAIRTELDKQEAIEYELKRQ